MKINWFKIDYNFIVNQLEMLLVYTEQREFVTFLLYLKLGYKCKDCENYYYDCECDYCKICRSKTCICGFINNYSYYDILSCMNNFVYKFTLFNINKIVINKIKDNTPSYVLDKLEHYENKLV